MKNSGNIFGLCLLLAVATLLPERSFAQAQFQQADELPSPHGAFLRSLVVPGWGHYYADKTNWNRGKYHLAADAALIVSYVGFHARANALETSYHTLAQSKAGVSLDGKGRTFKLALANYNSLQEYNAAQLELRNWNQLYPNTAEYNWTWESREMRIQYQHSRERVDRFRSQLPTLAALLVTNRLLSGLSAFVHARNINENMPHASLSYINEFGEPGITARVIIPFN